MSSSRISPNTSNSPSTKTSSSLFDLTSNPSPAIISREQNDTDPLQSSNSENSRSTDIHIDGERAVSSTSTTRTMSEDAISQDAGNDLMKRLPPRVESPSLQYPDDNIVDYVLDTVLPLVGQLHVLRVRNGNTLEPWPTGSERDTHRALASFLTSIVSVFIKWQESNSKPLSYFSGLQFFVQDRYMKDTPGNVVPLEPDVVGMKVDPDSLDLATSWRDVRMVVHPNAADAHAYRHLATYAEYALTAQWELMFIHTIKFQHQNQKIGFITFDYEGAVDFPFCDLNTRSGAREFISHFLQILSATSAHDAGINPHFSRDQVILPNQFKYRVSRRIFERRHVGGRNTLVVLITPENQGAQAQDAPPTEIERLSDELSRSEHEIFQKTKDVPFGLTHSWNLWEGGSTESSRYRSRDSIREDMSALMENEVKPLSSAATPFELLRGILHAMIGIGNLFEDGWLHRNISDVSIVLLERPLKCEAVPSLTKETDCYGLVVGTELAEEWAKIGKEGILDIVGTVPFLGNRVIAACGGPKTFRHSVIDDLESCLWVLVYELLAHAKESQTLIEIEQEILKNLDEDDLFKISFSRSYICFNHPSDDRSPIIDLFIPLLARWWKIAGEASCEIPQQPQEGRATDEYQGKCKAHLKKVLSRYLEAGYEFMKCEGMELKWDAIV